MSEHNPQDYQHWRLDYDATGIACLTLDYANGVVNVLSEAVLEELETALRQIMQDAPRGLIIASAKPQGFLAGADITEFLHLENHQRALQKLRYGQELFERITQLQCPSVARIHGHCVGGGLELALACDWRVAEDVPSCRLGLPEVRLGIHPGYGGTVRLPELIGDLSAMSLMLRGQLVQAKQARAMGIIDYAEPFRQLDIAAHHLAVKMPQRHGPRFHTVTRLSPVRLMLAAIMRRQIRQHVRHDHYPAPYQLIDCWQRAPELKAAQLEAEAQSVATLFSSQTAKNLVRVFFLRERLKAQGKKRLFQVRHVHVIGAGTMGGDIAAWCALQGMRVTLQDREPELIAPAIVRARALFQKKLKQQHEQTATCDRLIPDSNADGISQADVVIEAVSENLDIKRAIYAMVEPQLKADAVLATNTSSIPLQQLAQGLSRPERIIGLHFFNPVAKMELVEVVHSSVTDPAIVEQAAAFVRTIQRLPLLVQSAPGFVINRILMPYLLEAITLIEEGMSPTTIDTAAENFGMPMGPVALADTVGLDVCLSVAQVLGQAFNRTVPSSLTRHVETQELGRKTGQGYYRWKKGKPQRTRLRRFHQVESDITERLTMVLLKEAMACLSEQLVASPDLLDAGMIFGTGFAPFRGGPIHYLKDLGVGRTRMILEKLVNRYGNRFEPGDNWEQILQVAE